MGLLASGCDNARSKGQPASQEPPAASRPAAEPTASPKESARVPVDRELPDESPSEQTGFDFSFSSPESEETVARPDYRGPAHPGLEKKQAARIVGELIRDAVDYGPTLVVWMFDRSASAQPLVTSFGNALREPYDSFVRLPQTTGADASQAPLLTAVCGFGSDVQFLVDPPSADPLSFGQALDRLTLDGGSQEMPFAAIEQVLEKYLPFRTRQRREVLVVLVTDEAGNDSAAVDDLIDLPKRHEIPIYVIGVPAPFGRAAALDASVESAAGDAANKSLAIHQGPESRSAERAPPAVLGAAFRSRADRLGLRPVRARVAMS